MILVNVFCYSTFGQSQASCFPRCLVIILSWGNRTCKSAEFVRTSNKSVSLDELLPRQLYNDPMVHQVKVNGSHQTYHPENWFHTHKYQNKVWHLSNLVVHNLFLAWKAPPKKLKRLPQPQSLTLTGEVTNNNSDVQNHNRFPQMYATGKCIT